MAVVVDAYLRRATGYFVPSKSGALKAFDDKHPNHKGLKAELTFTLWNTKTDEAHDELRLSLAPTTYQRQPMTRLALHPTAGGYHVDMPSISARGLVQYVIQGNTGVYPARRPGAMGHDGMHEIERLRRLFETLLHGDNDRLEIGGKPRSWFELRFENTDEPVSAAGESDHSYVVVPQASAVQTVRDARVRGVWNYIIRIAATRSTGDVRVPAVNFEKKKNLLDKIDGLLEVLQLLDVDRVFAAYRDLLGPLQRVRGQLRTFAGFVERWRTGYQQFFDYPLHQAQGLVDDLNRVIEALGAEGGVFPNGRSSEPSERARELQLATYELQRVINGIATTESMSAGLRDAAPAIGGPQSGSGVALRSPMQVANTSVRLSPADQQAGLARSSGIGQPVSTTLVEVGFADSLEDFVPPGFTDVDLLQLNPLLEWPFVDGARTRPAGDTSGVAFIGERVRVPSTSGSEAAVSQADSPEQERAASRSTEEERVFGVDIAVDPATGSLRLDEAAGDLATVGGEANLVARLRRGLLLRRRSLRYAPEVGTFLAGPVWTSNAMRLRTMNDVRRSLLQDPGIARVTSLRVDAENGQTTVAFDADTVAGTPLGSAALGA